MFNGVDAHAYLFILTQERLRKLFNHHPGLMFDFLIVDEAHNIFESDDRNILLSSVIWAAWKRNNNVVLKFLTPFVSDAENLKIKNVNYNPNPFTISECVKSERIYVADFRCDKPKKFFYDQYLDEDFDLTCNISDPFEYIKSESVAKNLVYLNRPKHLQEAAISFAQTLPLINDPLINEAIAILEGRIHIDYLLISCLKKGIVYHHGSVPENVRFFIEFLFINCKAVKYLFANSTLIEGINLPIEKIFLLSVSKGRGNLGPSSFRNLIGRVNRFGDIFSKPAPLALQALEPEIHIVGSDDYLRDNANIGRFLKEVARLGKKIKDAPKNELLENVEITPENEERFDSITDRLGNLEGSFEGEDFKECHTDVGLALIENNVFEIDVFKNEKNIETRLQLFNNLKPISDVRLLVDLIFEVFIDYFEPSLLSTRDSPFKLNPKAKNFYKRFLEWRLLNEPFQKIVSRFINYWSTFPRGGLVYAGKWGDECKPGGFRPVFIDIHTKNSAEKVNLAIVRVKEEEEFLDFSLFRFVDILNELDYLDEGFFKLIKYGTVDQEVIILIKNGFNRNVAELLKGQFRNQYVITRDVAVFHPSILESLESSGVDRLTILEIERCASISN